MLTSSLVGYEHRDITAGLRYTCWFSPHNYRCACKSVATDSNISAGRDATLTDVHAGRVQLQPTCQAVGCNCNKHACCLNAKFKDMGAATGLTISMPVGVFPNYRPCLLVWCLIINHTCSCVASLYAMPSGVVPHYQPCLLVWHLTLGHAFWCGTSLSAMPIGMVPHYRPCQLVWYLTIGHACWSFATATDILLVGWLQVWFYLYRAVIILYMSADLVPLSDMPICTVQLYQTCMLGTFIQIRVLVKCCSIRQGIWSIANPSDMPTGRVSLPWDCQTCWLPSWTPS